MKYRHGRFRIISIFPDETRKVRNTDGALGALMLKIAWLLFRELLTYFCLSEQINVGARQTVL